MKDTCAHMALKDVFTLFPWLQKRKLYNDMEWNDTLHVFFYEYNKSKPRLLIRNSG